MQLTIGADPEVFVKCGRLNASAHGMIPGTKEKPFPVENGAVQVDGMALEFNIDPASDVDSFLHNIKSVLNTLQEMIPPNHTLNVVPAVKFTDNLMDKQPEIAKRLGCEADYNAWTERTNPPPDNNTNLRTAAGHIHIGWGTDFDIHDPAHFLGGCQLARQLDFYLGLPSLLFDSDTERRKLYGKAGAFRPKPYGMEYRVLSNFWLKHEALQEMVYNLTILAVGKLRRFGREVVQGGENLGYYYQNLSDVGNNYLNSDRLQDIIANSRVDEAEAIVKSHEVLNRQVETAIQKMKGEEK